jgi:C4-dicarboxylate transporter DctM subunit
MVLTLIVIALAGMLVGIPFAFSLLLGVTLATAIFEPSGLSNLPLLAMSDINDPLIIAIPMLIIAGEMLSAVGAIEPIVDTWQRVFGRIRGSLGLCCVGTSLFFAGSTGSSAAESAAVASAFQVPMEARGYSRSYVASLVVASTAIGILLPPSIAMILYAQVINYSVTQLWIAGIFPALLAAALIALVSMVLARRMQRRAPTTVPAAAVPAAVPAAAPVAETSETAEAAEAAETAEAAGAAPAVHGVRKVIASVTGVLIPVLVVGGIYSGVLTLSEVAAALVAVVVIYGLLITRIGGRRLFGAARVGAQRAGAVFLIVIAARLFSNVLVEQQTIVGLLNTVNHLHLSKFLTLLIANIAMLMAGTLMDGLSLIIIGAPILYTILTPFGISPVHLAIIMAMNLEIGVMHPPLGGNLFAVSSVTGVRVGRIARDVLPYLAVLLIMLMLVTYVPVPGFAWN